MASHEQHIENKNTNCKLKILSLNVRGLRKKKKRCALFRKFKTENFDIISLQETHLSKTDNSLIMREWGSSFHIAEGSNSSKGLLTLFGKNIDFSNTACVLENERCLISHLAIDDATFAFVNIYAPCVSTEKLAFLNSINGFIDQSSSKLCDHLMMMGDFNIVMNNSLDIVSGDYHNKKFVESFNNVVNELLLIDIWRLMHGNKKEFTWSKSNPFIARRIDFIFTSESIVPFCKFSDINFLGFSDHKGVILHTDFSTFKRGPSTYKFNINLLKNKNFVDEVIKEITRIETLDLDPHLCWDYIKVMIRDKGMSYGKILASNKRNEKKMLIDQIKDCENSLMHSPDDEQTLRDYSRAKAKYEIIEISEAEGARIRSGQKWAQEGEKCT